ncbi:MAG: DUF2127 domain-containing protein [Syntrophaceae bacterium]|nr:DUF2127 domain-containing protein [Syntrophaceae bacterium]
MGSGKNTFGLLLIGSFKLLLAFLLLSVSIGLFTVMNRELGDEIRAVILDWQLKTASEIVNWFLSLLLSVHIEELQRIRAGTFVYSGLLLVEGIGLLMRKRWAEFLTIIVTGSLIPLEIRKMIAEISVVEVVVLLINTAILVYLVYILLRGYRRSKRIRSEVYDRSRSSSRILNR